MTLPETKAALSLSYGGVDIQSPEPTPAPYFANNPAAVADFKRNMPALTMTSSSITLSAEGEAHNLLIDRFDLGAKLGARMPSSTNTGSLWAINTSLFAQYRINSADKLSVPVRLLLGFEHFSGEAFSFPEASKQSLSGTIFKTGASVGVEYLAFHEYPVSFSLEGYVAPSSADLGHGFNVPAGVSGMFVISAGKLFDSGSSSAAKRITKEDNRTDNDCAEAAAGLRFGKNALSDAAGKCKDSALPVFEAMAKLLNDFKLETGNAANLKEYRLSLKQFSEGISSAVKASKLTDAEAIAMMKQLVLLNKKLFSEIFSNPANPKDSLEAGLTALRYPILPLLKAIPTDTEVKTNADDALTLILECAKNEGKDFLLNVLEGLVTMGTDSAWLKSHKKDLLDAAKKISVKADRTDIEKSIQKTFK